jgi:CheY-like chemotaxis protein
MSDVAPPICVLIVDDDREIRELLGELLTEEGFAVEASWNGKTALARLEEGLRPDVIVLDIMMPAMDGLAFRAAQKKHSAIADIPVIGLTAFPALAADFECLTKPVKLQVLIDAIRSAARRPRD